VIERPAKTEPFDEWKEVGWRKRRPRRPIPPYQRFYADNSFAVARDLRLVVEDELAVLERRPDRREVRRRAVAPSPSEGSYTRNGRRTLRASSRAISRCTRRPSASVPWTGTIAIAIVG
jgi:hypothetical protein